MVDLSIVFCRFTRPNNLDETGQDSIQMQLRGGRPSWTMFLGWVTGWVLLCIVVEWGNLPTKRVAYCNWLVAWNRFIFHDIWECHHPNWRTPWFFRGVGIPPDDIIWYPVVGYLQETDHNYIEGGVVWCLLRFFRPLWCESPGYPLTSTAKLLGKLASACARAHPLHRCHDINAWYLPQFVGVVCFIPGCQKKMPSYPHQVPVLDIKPHNAHTSNQKLPHGRNINMCSKMVHFHRSAIRHSSLVKVHGSLCGKWANHRTWCGNCPASHAWWPEGTQL